MADSNYGTLITVAGITGVVTSVSAPKISVGSIEKTNHSSGGWREYIADNLKGGGSFSVSMEVSGALVADVWDVWSAAEPVAIVFTEQACPAWSFDGLLTTFDLGTADASKPNEEIVILTIQPTGEITVAAAVGDWYTDVTALFLDVGDYAILTAGTHQLVVTAYAPGLPPFEVPDYSDLGFTTSDGAKATVSAAGLITGAAAGTTYIKVKITAKANVNVTIKVTDSTP